MIQMLFHTVTDFFFRSKRPHQGLTKFMNESRQRPDDISLIGKFKVLLINSYDLEKVLEMSKSGKFPDHHLFGARQLTEQHNIQVTIPPHIKYPLLNKIGNIFDIEFLDQQFRFLITLDQCNIIYAPFAAANTKLIVLLKALGLIRMPVVILVHQPLFGQPSPNRFWRWLVRRLIMSYETILFFSQVLRDELIQAYEIDQATVKRRFHVAHLGADVDFFKKFIIPNNQGEGNYLISSGNTGRDFDILVKVAQRVAFPIKIYCKPESFPRATVIPKNVEILSGEFPFEQICKDIANARIVLIPLAADPKATTGLISLLETMALGKPVIMTKNKYIDIDFEKENIGLTVNENDIDGWVQTITLLLGDHQRLKKMGENGLRFATEKLNINLFAKDLAKAMEDTHQRFLDKNSK